VVILELRSAVVLVVKTLQSKLALSGQASLFFGYVHTAWWKTKAHLFDVFWQQRIIGTLMSVNALDCCSFDAARL